MSWALELPFAKPMSLNQRLHWAVKAKTTKEWRDATIVLAKHAKIPVLSLISVQLFYEPATSTRRDPLNLVQTLKAVEDGLVSAKVIPDDDPTHLLSVMPIILPKGPGHATGRFWAVISEV